MEEGLLDGLGASRVAYSSENTAVMRCSGALETL